jgi:predicted nucleotidyltransferase
MKRDYAIERLVEILPTAQARYGVRALYVFGSVARDEATDDSDIDILVDFEGAPTFLGYMGLKLYLEDTLGLRVDLATRRALRPRMRPRIEAEALRVA